MPAYRVAKPVRGVKYNGHAMAGEKDAWAQVGKVGSFGLTIGVAMLVCGALGRWLDARLGTTPVLTILLFLAGGGSALWYGIVAILR